MYILELTREQMIQLAMLVGSDYTVGLSGIGPVTAMEILAYFKKNLSTSSSSSSSENTTVTEVTSTLQDFKEWWKTNRNKKVPLAKKLKDIVISEGIVLSIEYILMIYYGC